MNGLYQDLGNYFSDHVIVVFGLVAVALIIISITLRSTSPGISPLSLDPTRLYNRRQSRGINIIVGGIALAVQGVIFASLVTSYAASQTATSGGNSDPILPQVKYGEFAMILCGILCIYLGYRILHSNKSPDNT